LREELLKPKASLIHDTTKYFGSGNENVVDIGEGLEYC